MNGGDGGDVAAAPAGPPPPLEWKFSQVFGERTAGEEVQEGNLLLFFFQNFYFTYTPLLHLDPWLVRCQCSN